jgi:hypothetical protein
MIRLKLLLGFFGILAAAGCCGCSTEESVRRAEEPSYLKWTRPWDNYEYENGYRGNYELP